MIKRIEKAKTIAELEKIKGYYKPEAAQFAIINFKNRTLLLKFNTDGTFKLVVDKFGEPMWFDTFYETYFETRDIFVIELNNKQTLINKFGNPISKTYDTIELNGNKMFKVKKIVDSDDKWGVID